MLLPKTAAVTKAVDVIGRTLADDSDKRQPGTEGLTRDAQYVRRQVDRLNVAVSDSLESSSTPQQRDTIIAQLRAIIRAAEESLSVLKA